MDLRQQRRPAVPHADHRREPAIRRERVPRGHAECAPERCFAWRDTAAGLEFQGWSGGCAGSLEQLQLVLNANTTVTANFGYPLSWLQLNPATNAAPKGNLVLQNPISMAFDVARQQVVYFGGPAGDQTRTERHNVDEA